MALLAGATVPVLGMLPMELAAQGQVELGAGFSSEDSFKLGEYNGLVDSQVFGVGVFPWKTLPAMMRTLRPGGH